MMLEPSNYTETQPGLWIGIPYQIADLGTQHFEYMGESKFTRKVRVTWEMPEQPKDDGRPLAVSKEYSLSWNAKSHLAEDMKAGYGADPSQKFDLKEILGKPCMLNVVLQQKKDGSGSYPKIAGLAPLRSQDKDKGYTAENPLVCFFIGTEKSGYAEFDKTAFNGLPDFVREKIVKSPEYAEWQLLKDKEALYGSATENPAEYLTA